MTVAKQCPICFRPDCERDHRVCSPPVRSEQPLSPPVAHVLARGCKCGKRMLEHANEGTCLWCGYGRAHAVLEHAYQRNMRENDFRFEPLPAAVPLHRWSEDECVRAYRQWTAAAGRTPAPADWAASRASGEVARPSLQTVRVRFGDWHGFLRYIASVPREQAA